MHWWTSGGEAKSLEVLKEMFTAEGHSWVDAKGSAGGGGQNTLQELKQRAYVTNNPPDMAQLKGMTVFDYASDGKLKHFNDTANREKWGSLIAAPIKRAMQFKGNYYAIPFNIHRVNWLWVNVSMLDRVDATPPTTWLEFVKVADALQDGGYTVVAHGNTPWQHGTLFESIALSVGKAAWFSSAFLALEQSSIESKFMTMAFNRFRTYQSYVGKQYADASWDKATLALIENEAAFQVMGDWAKGEFLNHGQLPVFDFQCVPFPDTTGSFTFVIDSFVGFTQEDKTVSKAQSKLASLIMSPKFQEEFNLRKGSIPVRSDVNMGRFDSCSRKSMTDFQAAALNDNLLPSWSNHSGQRVNIVDAINDVLTSFWNDKSMSAESAVRKLSAAITKVR